MFEEYGFGGFILFSRNCCDADALLSLTRALWESAAEHPPFVAIDHEGGLVHRLPPPFTHFPTAAAIGNQNDPDFAYRAGYAAAVELRWAGFNLNFAPVLDVNSNPDNPIIGSRAFGSTPERVVEIALAWARGLRDGGIIPCGKHFPGHGDTNKDSHLELPMVGKSLDQLKATELAPFAAACRSEIESLMTAHLLYPALDPQFPATLSERIITGWLRQQLGYDGVVFSDDLAMRAISDRYAVEDRALFSLMAGVDVLLFCHELDDAMQAVEAINNAAESDAAVRARVDKSYKRVVTLKQHYLKEFTGLNSDELRENISSGQHRALIVQIQGNL